MQNIKLLLVGVIVCFPIFLNSCNQIVTKFQISRFFVRMLWAKNITSLAIILLKDNRKILLNACVYVYGPKQFTSDLHLRTCKTFHSSQVFYFIHVNGEYRHWVNHVHELFPKIIKTRANGTHRFSCNTLFT